MPTKIEDQSDWRAACAQISIDFAVYIDHGNFDGVLSLFTEDGCLMRPGHVSRGHAELRKWLVEERPVQLIRHVCSNFSGELIKADEVHGKTYFTTYRAMGEHNLPVSGNVSLIVGEWDDVFHRTSAGWRILSRTVTIAFQVEV